jgi:hypothetical protein
MLKKLRRSLLLWHRRVGALIAVFLLMLAVTGLLLNHTERLQLADQPVKSDLWLSQYGLERPEVVSYPVGDGWLSHLGGNYAYLNEREVGYCEAPLSGAVAFTEMIVVACDQVLLLLTLSGDVIERVDHSYGLPEGGLQGLAGAGEALLVKVTGQWFQADMMSMQFSPYPDAAVSVTRRDLPESLEQQLLLNFRGEDIHWERLLLDLHSGRLFGVSGVVWMDLVALMLIWVAGTGVWVWATRPRR